MCVVEKCVFEIFDRIDLWETLERGAKHFLHNQDEALSNSSRRAADRLLRCDGQHRAGDCGGLAATGAAAADDERFGVAGLRRYTVRLGVKAIDHADVQAAVGQVLIERLQLVRKVVT